MINTDSLIESWTQEERNKIYIALEKLNIGCITLDATTNTMCLRFKGDIPAKTTQPIVQRSYVTMKPNKLIILEPSFELVEREYVHVAAKIEKTLWRTRIVEPEKHTTIEHKRFVTVPRSTWRLRGMFSGANNCFSTETDIPGDLFGPNGQIRLHADCMAGIDTTLQIENTTEQAMPFYAVLLGEEIKRSSLKGAAS